MNVLADLRRPDSAVLTLRTLTPLYTGGVGQHGDQIHPSGLLGGVRRFSCLLAAAVGDADFETRVWGSTADDRHAKRIGLRVDADASRLEKIRPVAGKGCINWPRSDGVNRQGWYYNAAHEGDLRLTLTRRGISDPHWQLLLLALRIQIRHATFGSRDQWGLGVLAADALPDVEPLQPPLAAPLPDKPGLHRALFAEIQFSRPLPQGWQARLEQGLRWRERLRNSLRGDDLDDLRHYVFGQLNRHGNAVNISALYPHGNGCALRVWGVLPHTTTPLETPRHAPRKDWEEYEYRRKILEEAINRRGEIIGRLRAALNEGTHNLTWQDALDHQENFINWINQMAGVVA